MASIVKRLMISASWEIQPSTIAAKGRCCQTLNGGNRGFCAWGSLLTCTMGIVWSMVGRVRFLAVGMVAISEYRWCSSGLSLLHFRL